MFLGVDVLTPPAWQSGVARPDESMIEEFPIKEQKDRPCLKCVDILTVEDDYSEESFPSV